MTKYMRTTAVIALLSAVAACTATGAFMSDKEIASYKAKISAADSAAMRFSCPSPDASAGADVATAAAKLETQIAASRAMVKKAGADFLKATWGETSNVVTSDTIDRATHYYDTARDTAAADLLTATLGWEQAVARQLASDATPLDPARYADHPVWKGSGPYDATKRALRAEVDAYDNERIDSYNSRVSRWLISEKRSTKFSTTRTRFGDALRNAGSHIDSCAAGYRASVAARNAPALVSHAQTFRSPSEFDQYFRAMGVSVGADAPASAQPLQAPLANIRAQLVAVEQQKATAERDRLAAQARQAQIAENERRAAAAEAERQRQIAAAKAQVELEKNQEVWRARWASTHKAANYKCEGGTYTKGVPLAPARGRYASLEFFIRLPPDYRFIEITDSRGEDGFASGRRDIKFTSPTAVTFTFNHREGGVLGIPETLWPGSVTIDLDNGDVTGGFSHVAQPLNVSLSTTYEMYCAKY